MIMNIIVLTNTVMFKVIVVVSILPSEGGISIFVLLMYNFVFTVE